MWEKLPEQVQQMAEAIKGKAGARSKMTALVNQTLSKNAKGNYTVQDLANIPVYQEWRTYDDKKYFDDYAGGHRMLIWGYMFRTMLRTCSPRVPLVFQPCSGYVPHVLLACPPMTTYKLYKKTPRVVRRNTVQPVFKQHTNT